MKAARSHHREGGMAMVRKCSHCLKDFTPNGLAREETRGMEAERKAMGLEGVLFRYYVCSSCGADSILVEIKPLEGESAEAFKRRRDDLERVINQVHGRAVEAVLVAK